MTETGEYAALMHGAQAFAYYLAYRFHTRRGRTLYRAVSVVGISYHVWATYKHIRDKD